MNIFALDENPTQAAQYLCDKHVPKMVLESAQLLCGAFPGGRAPYRRTHHNHPVAKWTRASRENYRWLLRHAMALCKEYALRFGRVHASTTPIYWCAWNYDMLNLPGGPRSPFARAMPLKYMHADPVQAYRDYYIGEKSRFAKWAHGRRPPEWWPDLCDGHPMPGGPF